MDYSERLMDELRAVGVSPRGFRDGEPFGYPQENRQLVLAVGAAHIPDESAYLSTNLETYAAELKTFLGAQSPEWSAYLRVQTDLIRSRRREKYVEAGGLNQRILEMISDGETFLNAVDASVAAKEAVKQLYPWPGTYR